MLTLNTTQIRFFICLALVLPLAPGCVYDEDTGMIIPAANDSFQSDEYAPIVTTSTTPTNSDDVVDPLSVNPFVFTAHDPFSTFAADVDTASYDIFRSNMNHNLGLPDQSTVRLEEFVNYFQYDYPVPDDAADHPFTVSLAAAPGIFNTNTRLLRVGIQAAKMEKPATNIVFLIDTSGSMTGDKLNSVKALLTETLNLLDPGDKVSIVTYAGAAGVALPATDAENRTLIEEKINSFAAGGSTAGAAGIDTAYEQAAAGFIDGGINHVILCTDGDFNVGPSSEDALLSLIEQKRETGITLAVLGFGDSPNDGMMETISNAGNGVYGVINGIADAERYVENEMFSSIMFVAKDMKIQVEFNKESVLAYRLLGYENRAIADQDFRVDTVDAGEVGSGHQVTALYELVMVGGEVPTVDGAPVPVDGETSKLPTEIAVDDMVLVKVRYKAPDATAADDATEMNVSLANADVLNTLADADQDMQWAAAVAAFAEILRGSPYASLDNLDEITTIITAKNWLDGARAEFVTLFDTASSLL